MLPLRTDDKAACVLLCFALCLQADDAIARIGEAQIRFVPIRHFKPVPKFRERSRRENNSNVPAVAQDLQRLRLV